MRLLRHLNDRNRHGAGYVATIGGFDGLHRGHRVLIDRAITLAGERRLTSMVMTFEPLPREYLVPDDPPARLTSFRERWRLLDNGGPERLCVLRFGAVLRSLSAEQFTERLAAMGVRALVIGHDFRAGRGGAASAEWFEREGPRYGLHVEVIAAVADDSASFERVSSSAVRAALGRGDLERARELLGRRYSMRGRVIAGEKLGRTLGFPTANLRLSRRRSPMDGIFAVRVRGVGNGYPASASLPGVASLGTRPTVNGVEPLLEAHVFDFAGDLYGREIEVEFIERLRDELKFTSVDAMVEQMHRDAAQARDALARSDFL